MKMKVAEAAAVLEVTLGEATEEEVKLQYRTKALACHPDKVREWGGDWDVCTNVSIDKFINRSINRSMDGN